MGLFSLGVVPRPPDHRFPSFSLLLLVRGGILDSKI